MANSASSLSELVPKLTSSLQAANTALPAPETAAPPPSGISLIDIKSEIFLSYLQNLVFLVLLKLKHTPHDAPDASQEISEDIRKKLVELRVYLEKGIRPLENKLKYQIDKVIRAADAADRASAAAAQKSVQKNASQVSMNGGEQSESSEEASDAGSESEASSADSIDDLAFRPNPDAFVNGTQQTQDKKSKKPPSAKPSDSSDVYRPPRITPTALPTTDQSMDRREGGSRSRRAQRSNAIDEYVASEMSAAPLAEPSIGSTIVSGGRRDKSAKERREEAERTAYEEANFVRLPGVGKKERAKRARGEGGFGGEDLRGLGDGLDRIGRLTKKQRGGRATEDGPRGEGFNTWRKGNKKRKI